MKDKKFGEILIELRTKNKLSQQQLAKVSSYTQTYISLIETNKANPSERCRKALLEILES